MNQESIVEHQGIVQTKRQGELSWSEIDMIREPASHRDNKPLNEVLFYSCYDRTYDLSKQESKEWWNLRVDLYYLYDEQDENCIKRIHGLWYILTDTDCQSIKNPKWTDFGFQQKDPTTDFRGGGIQSLDDLINFASNNKEYIIHTMCDPKNEFYFAASSINVTFFMKKYFHLLDSIDSRDKNEICGRVAFKNFCHLLVKEDNLWQRLHSLFLMDLFQIWMKFRDRKFKSGQTPTILDFDQLNMDNNNLRTCRQQGHQGEKAICININSKAKEKWGCGKCSVQNKAQEFILVEEFHNQVKQLSVYNEQLNVKTRIKQTNEQIYRMCEQFKSAIDMWSQQLNNELTNAQIQNELQCNLINGAILNDPLKLSNDDISLLLQMMNGFPKIEMEDQILLENVNCQLREAQDQMSLFIQPLMKQQGEQLVNKMLQSQILRDLYQQQEQLFDEGLPVHLDDIKGQVNSLIQELEFNIQYLGEFNDYCPHGIGLLVNQNTKCLYKGVWVDGELVWGIKIDITKGVLYRGHMTQSDQYSYGVFDKGMSVNDQNELYEGEFMNDLQTGFGIMKYQDKSCYEGNWNQGKFDGKGKLTFSNNHTYEGQFNKGVISGTGILKCGTEVYNGQFINGVKHGVGELVVAKQYKYIGEFQNNKRQGKGIIKYETGNQYEGQFMNDLKHGHGIETELIVEQIDQEAQGKINITESMYKKLQDGDVVNKRQTKHITEGEYRMDCRHDFHILTKTNMQGQQLECILISYNMGVETNREVVKC